MLTWLIMKNWYQYFIPLLLTNFLAAYKFLRWLEIFLQVLKNFSGASKYSLKLGIGQPDFSHRDDNGLA